MTALALKEPDQVPFADYTEEPIRKMIMGKDDFSGSKR